MSRDATLSHLQPGGSGKSVSHSESKISNSLTKPNLAVKSKKRIGVIENKKAKRKKN